MVIVHWIKSFQRYLGIPLATCSLVSADSHKWCGSSMKPLRIELASKMGGKEVWEGSYFRGRTLTDSLQTGGHENCGRRRSRRSTKELKHLTFSTGRRQPEVKFTSDPRFPPTESTVATLRRLCFAYFDVACKTWVSLLWFSCFYIILPAMFCT